MRPKRLNEAREARIWTGYGRRVTAIAPWCVALLPPSTHAACAQVVLGAGRLAAGCGGVCKGHGAVRVTGRECGRYIEGQLRVW